MRWLFFVTSWMLLIAGTGTVTFAQGPSLRITAPENGAVINGSSVTLKFEASNFKISTSSVPEAEAGMRPDANYPGEGHLRLMLDVWPVVTVQAGNSYTFTNVPPGEHQVTVELVNNDHSSLSPPVVQSIRFRTMMMMPSTGIGRTQLMYMLLIAVVVMLPIGTLTVRHAPMRRVLVKRPPVRLRVRK